MKFKVTATIPVGQYANIMPEIEVDQALTYEQARDEAMGKLADLWEQYGVVPLTKQTGATVRRKDFFGNEIDYDELNHVYSWNGEVYESGSQYASKRKKPFDMDSISGKMAEKYGVKAGDISDVWKMSGEISRDFGTLLHKMLEMYGKYKELATKMDKEYHITNHPILKTAVESFYVGRESEKAEYEVLVVDHKAKRAGTIDRLLITAPNTCVIQDFKITNKEDKEYWDDQLGFYEGILEANNWVVSGKEIFKYDGAWTTYNKEGQDVLS